jgi:tRNA isopentenyl-2-thiomethyl-A-37 hydroxylase MiaE
VASRRNHAQHYLLAVAAAVAAIDLVRRGHKDCECEAPRDTWDLAVDEQVAKFVELRQKLTYFLITASVAVAAFSINFYVKSVRKDPTMTALHPVLLVAACVAALSTGGFALLTLHLDHRSFARHLGLRYERRRFQDLPQRQQTSWNRLTNLAATALLLAFVALFGEILLMLLFFIPAFL